jgi:hypothetical protein
MVGLQSDCGDAAVKVWMLAVLTPFGYGPPRDAFCPRVWRVEVSIGPPVYRAVGCVHLPDRAATDLRDIRFKTNRDP